MALLKKIALFSTGKPEETGEKNGCVKIKGNFYGKLRGCCRVVISDTGSLKGEISARVLEVYGAAEGKASVDDLLIHSTGQLHYQTLSYRNLNLEEGGVLKTPRRQR